MRHFMIQLDLQGYSSNLNAAADVSTAWLGYWFHGYQRSLICCRDAKNELRAGSTYSAYIKRLLPSCAGSVSTEQFVVSKTDCAG